MSNRGHPQQSQPRSRQKVHVGGLEQTLESFNAEMGQKMALSLHEYHNKYVEPRLKWLETPWYGKWWFRVTEVAKWLKAKLRPVKIDPSQICDCGYEEPHTIGMAGCKLVLENLDKLQEIVEEANE